MDASSQESPSGRPVPQSLAKASWVFPLIIVGMLTVSRIVPRAKTIVDMVALLLALIGFVLGIVSLFGIRRYGRRKILAPALVGILVNGFFILVWVTNFLTAVRAS